MRIMLRHRQVMGISQTLHTQCFALVCAALALALARPVLLNAQTDPARVNPLRRDPAAIEAGDELFHERCAVCHGQRAQGAMAPDLVRTRTVTRGAEAALFGLIRNGIPGTDMPPQPDLEDTGIWQIVTYLRALALPGQQPPLKGDPDAGRRVFRQAGCVSCHVVDGTGGFLGHHWIQSLRKTGERAPGRGKATARCAASVRNVPTACPTGSSLRNREIDRITRETVDSDVKYF